MKNTKRNDLLVDVRMPIRDELVANLRELGLSKLVAENLVQAYPDGRGLAGAGKNALMDLGVTEKLAKRVVAAFRVSDVCDRSCQARASTLQMKDPRSAAEVFRRAIGRKEQEYFAVALLDARQQVIDVMGVAVGSLSQVDVHPRELFREAVRRGTHSIIMAHNHPSGDSSPSEADIALTNRMVEAGRLMGIPVLDHVVMTATDSTSLAASGLMSQGNPAPTSKKRLMR